MSLVSIIGPRPNLLGHHAGNYLRLEVAQPILTNTDLEKIRDIDNLAGGAFRTQTIDITWPASEGADGMEKAIERICQEATEAVLADYTILILSDRDAGENRIPIPSLLATAAVHNHLIRQGLRMSTGIVVETGEAREVHHFCVLAGYGAEAINPYLAFETLEQIRVQSKMKKSAAEVKKNYLKAVGKGIMKVMSKMGISTYQSYCGAQIFDAVGLSPAFVDKCFTGTATTIEGVGFAEIAAGSGRAPQGRLWRQPDLPGHARCRRRLRLPPAWRGTCLDAGNDRQAAACGPRQSARRIPCLHPHDQRPERTPADHSRPDGVPPRPDAGPAGRGRAGEGDRQAFRHRGDELRLDITRGAHHAGDRHEPHRRQVQHRRGRRRIRSLQAAAERRFRALGDQAGRVRPLRRDDGISGQRRRPPDQDGAGCQARRGRSASGPQGGQEHRPRAPFHTGRRPDIAAAAPRHLFDRGPGAAHPRPEERQFQGAHFGQAGRPRSASAPSPPASRRRGRTTSPSPATRAAPAPAR